MNHVQRHIECIVDSCLQRKGSILTYCYNVTWEVQDESLLSIDEKGQNKYEPTCNDDSVNVHNVDLFTMGCANVDC